MTGRKRGRPRVNPEGVAYNLRGIPEDVWHRLRVEATRNKITLKVAIIQAITAWVEASEEEESFEK